MARKLLALLALAFTLGAIRASAAGPIYLGFLERGGGKPPQNADMPKFPRVRVAFQSVDGIWSVIHGEATDQDELAASANWYPSPIPWNAISDGKRLGEVTSVRPASTDWYGAVALQIVKSSTLPASMMAGTRGEAEIWPGMTAARPLLLVTGSSWHDPEEWKRISLSADTLDPIVDRLRKMFRAGVPASDPESGDTEDTVFDCGAGSLQLWRAYRSADGREVLILNLSRCTPPEDSLAGSPVYAVLRDGEKITPLGSDLWLIDAGDFDGDGQSEVIFGRSLGDNYDSYVLFSRRFRKRCEFGWHYH